MTERRRPRLFSFAREIELAQLEGWVSPDQIDLLTEVVDAFLEVTTTRQISPERLAPVMAAATHGSENVRAVGMSRLVVLAHYFPEAREAFTGLMGHADPEVQVYAASSLPSAPDEVLAPCVERCLQDASVELRKVGARMGASQRSFTLAQILGEALQGERDARVRVLLEQSLAYQAEA